MDKYLTKEEKKQINKKQVNKAFEKTKPKTKVETIDEVIEVDRWDEYGNEKSDIQIFHESHKSGKTLKDWFFSTDTNKVRKKQL